MRDLVDDLFRFLGPDKGFSVFVMTLSVFLDRGHQLRYASEHLNGARRPWRYWLGRLPLSPPGFHLSQNGITLAIKPHGENAEESPLLPGTRLCKIYTIKLTVPLFKNNNVAVAEIRIFEKRLQLGKGINRDGI